MQAKEYGDFVIAGMGAVTRIISMGSLMVFGFIKGFILAIFSTAIISQFTKSDTGLISIGGAALRANGVSFLLFGFYTVYSSLFLPLGKGKEGFFLGACRQGICFVPAILILPMVCGISGILYAQPVSDIIATVITAFMAVHLHKELKQARRQ